jgi:DNA primase
MKADTLADALAKGRGIERPFRCEAHDDHNASASVNTQTGLWCCYACGAAGKVDKSATIPDADTLLKLLKGEEPQRIYAESWLDIYDAAHVGKYWELRYGTKTAVHFRCGTHPMTGKATYPIKDAQGHVLGVVTRAKDGEVPKYLYPRGVSTSRTFFGDIKPSRVVVLVEGASDVMALHQSGIPDDWTVLGCYGAGLHEPQVQIVTDLAPRLIVAAFDNDAAGHAATSRAIERMGRITTVIGHSWAPANDPGDLPPDARIAAIEATIAKENT